MNPALAAYLHDHHAGAQTALTLIARLAEQDPSRREWLARIRDEIDADRATLRDIMQRLEIADTAAAPSPSERTPSRVEALEALTLGILGKHKLWMTLAAIARDYPPIQQIDFDRLRARAIEQHALIEPERLTAAILSFGSSVGSSQRKRFHAEG
jgi:hypothetical protein